MFYTIDAVKNISIFNEHVVKKEKQLSEALRDILKSNSKIKCIGSQAIDVLFSETKKIFDQNANLVGKISEIEQEKYKIHEKMKELEQSNQTLGMENDSLKQMLEYENNESNRNLAQVHRLEQRLDEFKRMNNEEFYKVKRDEIKTKKLLDEVKLNFQRSQDVIEKFKQKEDEINEHLEYFRAKKQKEEDSLIKAQLQYEKEKHSLLGIFQNKDKRPVL